MSVFNDLVNIWKGSDLLSEAWDESHKMILLSNNIFIKAIEGLRSGEKTKALKSIKKETKRSIVFIEMFEEKLSLIILLAEIH